MNRVVVVGASAGGIEAIRTLIGSIQPDIDASFFVVQHRAAEFQDVLPAVLKGKSALTVEPAVHGATPQRGHVYVAPPDQHLMLRPNVRADSE